MKFSLIICTYMRPKPLLTLLQSVQGQTLYPDEILIVDGSIDSETKSILDKNQFKNLQYFLVPNEYRGLTKQRNYGIERIGNDIEIVCFLDDDVVLEPDYFEQLIKTYEVYPQALGVGGYITNDAQCDFVGNDYKPKITEYFYDGWKRKESSRFVLRKRLGLDSNCTPGYYPSFGHERSVSFLPSSGKIYRVEMLMGGVSSFRKEVFKTQQFSTYFEGYGLYEDADFSLRLSQKGNLYLNTNAKLQHFHDASGRPNQYHYGKMVVRNGWYVWRIKNPNPSFKSRLKWNTITLILAFIRFLNTFSTPKKRAAFTESIGRLVGWCSLFWDKPKNKTAGLKAVRNIELISEGKKISILPLEDTLFKIPISIPEPFRTRVFDVEITFQYPIEKIRNIDYQWMDTHQDWIAIPFVPKIIKLSNGLFVQPNTTVGVWEFNKKYKNKLVWKFNHPDASSSTFYRSISERKYSNHKLPSPIVADTIKENFALLFSTTGGIEFSRSKIPFSAVACFTDHCDFDTVKNLEMQRKLLKDSGVNITKGFFMKHFSKREDGVSWQNNAEELKKWLEDGHELAYHSLTQSIMPKQESAEFFLNFQPLKEVSTWIDHGYQPYNFSLVENSKIVSRDAFFDKLNSSGITTIWNYIDSGVSTKGVINQLNASHFTLNTYWKGIQNTRFLNKIQRISKTIFHHYYAENNLLGHYKLISHNFKNIIFNYKFREIPSFFKNSFGVIIPVLKIIFFWNSYKNKTFRFAKYNAIIFPYIEKGKRLMMFQTIDMLDLKNSLAPENIDLLCQEKGLFIGHTYFSVPMSYHQGRMFLKEDSIDENVAENFRYLGQKIGNKEIWNPTLNELVEFLSLFQEIVLDVDPNGNIIIVNETQLAFRTVN